MKSRSKKSLSGFTLIELLVVIAIIGILSTLSVLLFQNIRSKARDAKRLYDLQQLAKAVELYYLENLSFPQNPLPGQSCQYSTPEETSSYSSICLQELVAQEYFPVLPTAPEDSFYLYYAYSPTDPNMPAAVVGTTLENTPPENSCDFPTGTWCNSSLTEEESERLPDSGANPNRFCICIFY